MEQIGSVVEPVAILGWRAEANIERLPAMGHLASIVAFSWHGSPKVELAVSAAVGAGLASKECAAVVHWIHLHVFFMVHVGAGKSLRK